MNDYQVLAWILVGAAVVLWALARVHDRITEANRMIDQGLALVDKEASK